MNTSGATPRKTRILALLWHSPYEFIVAGGFRRTQEILKRIPDDVQIYAIDSSPTMLAETTSGNLKVVEYGFPQSIRRLDKKCFVQMRLVEWALAMMSIIYICFRLKIGGEQFDSIYVPSSEIIPALVAGLIAKSLFGARLILCNTNIEFYPHSVRRFLAYLHSMSDQVITLSSDLEQSLRRNGVKAPIVLNTVGLDLDLITRSISGSDNRKSYEAVFVGRHDQGKGIFDLVKAWGKLTESLPEARLVTIGISTPDYAKRLERLIAELGLGKRIILSGVVDEVTKLRIIKESKVCLFPSYIEGWGIVPQEALACGLPVVVYDLPVYRENIKPCESVFAVPVGDIEAFAMKALELLSNELYNRYEEVGPEFVRRFDWAGVASAEFEILTGGSHKAQGVVADE